jgi:hypothetical protein
VACAKAITDQPDASTSDGSTPGDSGAPDVTKPVDGACPKPLSKCTDDAGPVCVDMTSDKEHCGSCTTVCKTADASGLAPGTGNPDPLVFDGGYDGGIGWTLGSADCKATTCGVDCPDAMALCSDQICYDTHNHHDHCGDCNTACASSTEWCTQGKCCAVGTLLCGSACTSLSDDTANCGSCGHQCDGGGCQNGKCVACAPATIAGPTLTQAINGWPKSGLRLTALKNTVLTSFVVNNQGTADTVYLTDTLGNVINTLSVPASNKTYTATVAWALTQGTSYDLILDGGSSGNNGMWVSYSSFPQSTLGLQVVDTIDQSQNLQTAYWFTFTNLVSCP